MLAVQRLWAGGFYLTDIIEQANALAQKKSRIYGGSPIIQKFKFKQEVMTPVN